MLRSRPCWRQRHEDLWRRGSVAERAMRSERIVIASPTFDHDPGFLQRIEDLSIQKLVSQTRVEAFNEAILPRTAWRDVGRSASNSSNPLLDSNGDELRAIIRADVLRNAPQNEQVRQDIDNIGRVQPAINPDRQAFSRKLVDDVQHPILPPLMRSILDKVIGPDMIWTFGAQPNA